MHVFFCVSKNVSVSCAYTQGKREQFSGFNRTLDAINNVFRKFSAFHDETGRLNVDGMNIISNDGSNKLNRSRKARVSYKVQRTINASLNADTSLKWLETNNLFNNLIQRNQSAAFSSGKVRPNHETNINIIARRTGKDVNSHTVLDGIITTIMATIQRINIIGSREGSRNRRRLKANQTGKKFRVGIKSNISTNRNNLISGVDRCIHLNAMKKTTITSINRQTIKI